jgi:hypothetical protein
MIKCKKCNILKEESSFYKRSRNKTGYRGECKQCCENRLLEIHMDKDIENFKCCSRCKEILSIDMFYQYPNKRYRANCTKCETIRVKKHQLKNLYGLSYIEYLKMVEQCDNKCHICNKEETAQGKSLAVDHNHKTGEIRGLLCQRCNIALGGFKENIDVMLQAIKYLSKRNP